MYSKFVLIFTLPKIDHRARTSVLGNIPGTSIYEDINICDEAKEFETIKMIRYEESVYYANVENFKYKIVKLCGINPDEVIAQAKANQEKQAKFSKNKVAFYIVNSYRMRQILQFYSLRLLPKRTIT